MSEISKANKTELQLIAKKLKITKWYKYDKENLIKQIISNGYENKNTCQGMSIYNNSFTRKCCHISDNKYCINHELQYKFEKDVCAICFDTIGENEIPLTCGHWFHKNCLKNIQNKICPICRNEMTHKEKIYIKSVPKISAKRVQVNSQPISAGRSNLNSNISATSSQSDENNRNRNFFQRIFCCF